MNIRTLILGATLAFTLMLGACSKATADNYAKIENGMTADQVHGILGKPDETTGGSLGGLTLTSEKWHGSKDVITITFLRDQVSIKSIEPVKKAEETAKP